MWIFEIKDTDTKITDIKITDFLISFVPNIGVTVQFHVTPKINPKFRGLYFG